MPNINFKITNFNKEVDELIKTLLVNIDKQNEEFHYQKTLSALLENLKQLYKEEKANALFSEFIQYFIHYFCHYSRFSDRVILPALEHFNNLIFYRPNPDSSIILWSESKEEMNALTSACRYGYKGIVELLLKIASEIEEETPHSLLQILFLQADKNGFTPLTSASRKGHLEIVKLLLSTAITYLGINTPLFQRIIQHEDNFGYNCLNSGAKGGYFKVVKYLLDAAYYGLSENMTQFAIFIQQTNNEGYAPLNTACRKGHLEVVKLLLSAAKKAFREENTPSFQTFLRHKDIYGCTPLNSASREGHEEIVKLLLEIGELTFGKGTTEFYQFLEDQNNHGFTPLNAACHENKENIARLLIEKGADPTIPNKRGYTANDNAPQLCSTFNRKQILSKFKQSAEGFLEENYPLSLEYKENKLIIFLHPSYVPPNASEDIARTWAAAILTTLLFPLKASFPNFSTAIKTKIDVTSPVFYLELRGKKDDLDHIKFLLEESGSLAHILPIERRYSTLTNKTSFLEAHYNCST